MVAADPTTGADPEPLGVGARPPCSALRMSRARALRVAAAAVGVVVACDEDAHAHVVTKASTRSRSRSRHSQNCCATLQRSSGNIMSRWGRRGQLSAAGNFSAILSLSPLPRCAEREPGEGKSPSRRERVVPSQRQPCGPRRATHVLARHGRRPV